LVFFWLSVFFSLFLYDILKISRAGLKQKFSMPLHIHGQHSVDFVKAFFLNMEKNKIEVVDMTPEMASKLLEKNIGNRAVSKNNLSFLKRQMKEGSFVFCADPIRISESGRVLDGQHRLIACVETGIGFKTLLVTGMDDSIFDKIDTGRPRNAADVLHISQIKNATVVAAAAKLILSYQKMKGKTFMMANSSEGYYKSGNFEKSFSNAEILEFAKNVDLQDAVLFAKQARQKLAIYTPAEYAFLYHIFEKVGGSEARDAFMEKLISGISLEPGDPVLLLRNRMISDLSTNLKIPARLRQYLTFKTWNLFRQGVKIKVLTYVSTDKLPDLI
jgi:hypothetical protein